VKEKHENWEEQEQEEQEVRAHVKTQSFRARSEDDNEVKEELEDWEEQEQEDQDDYSRLFSQVTIKIPIRDYYPERHIRYYYWEYRSMTSFEILLWGNTRGYGSIMWLATIRWTYYSKDWFYTVDRNYFPICVREEYSIFVFDTIMWGYDSALLFAIIIWNEYSTVFDIVIRD